jgi:hypothetical protein
VRAIVVSVLVARSAFAEPDPDPAFEACKVLRRALTHEAMKIADVVERGRALAKMPICRRFEDRSTEIVGDVPLPAPRSKPIAMHVEASATLGGGHWMIAESSTLAFADRAPFVEGELGVGLRDSLSLVGFAGYAELNGEATYVDFERRLAAPYVSHDQLVDVGARARLHHGNLAFGAGVGVEHVHAVGYCSLTGPRDDRISNTLIESDIGYTFAGVDRFAFRVSGIASAALNTTLEAPGNNISVRVALGITWHSNETTVGAWP